MKRGHQMIPQKYRNGLKSKRKTTFSTSTVSLSWFSQ